jgi:hypothetical protein
MSRIAGNAVDEVLPPLVLKACGIDPATGSPRSDAHFALIKTDLASQIRPLRRDGKPILLARPKGNRRSDNANCGFKLLPPAQPEKQNPPALFQRFLRGVMAENTARLQRAH